MTGTTAGPSIQKQSRRGTYDKHKQRVSQQLELFEEAGPLSA